MQRLELALHRRIITEIVPARRLRADRSRDGACPDARVERRATQDQKREPAHDQTRLRYAGHFEGGRLEHARGEDEEDARDREYVVAAEDRSEDCARF